MAKFNKAICKLGKKALEDNFDDLLKIVSNPKFVCKKCGRVANDSKFLCKDKKF